MSAVPWCARKAVPRFSRHISVRAHTHVIDDEIREKLTSFNTLLLAFFAAVTVGDPGRMAFLRQYFATVLGSAASKSAVLGAAGRAAAPPVPTHLILVSTAMSGAIVFGGIDMMLHRALGLRW